MLQFFALPIRQQNLYSTTQGELIFHDEKSITSASLVWEWYEFSRLPFNLWDALVQLKL